MSSSFSDIIANIFLTLLLNSMLYVSLSISVSPPPSALSVTPPQTPLRRITWSQRKISHVSMELCLSVSSTSWDVLEFNHNRNLKMCSFFLSFGLDWNKSCGWSLSAALKILKAIRRITLGYPLMQVTVQEFCPSAQMQSIYHCIWRNCCWCPQNFTVQLYRYCCCSRYAASFLSLSFWIKWPWVTSRIHVRLIILLRILHSFKLSACGKIS